MKKKVEDKICFDDGINIGARLEGHMWQKCQNET